MPRRSSGGRYRRQSSNLLGAAITALLAIATLGSFVGITLIPSKSLLSCEVARPILTCEAEKAALDKAATKQGNPSGEPTVPLGSPPIEGRQVANSGRSAEASPGLLMGTATSSPPSLPIFDKSLVARDPPGPSLPEKGGVQATGQQDKTVMLTPPASKVPEYPSLVSGSIWRFGDSLMRLERDYAVITVYYDRPRAGLVAVGVKPGFLFLKASLKPDGTFSGDAYRFSKTCPNPRYSVTGKVDLKSGVIRMSGRVSWVNENCEILFDDKITDSEFNLLDDAAVAAAKRAV